MPYDPNRHHRRSVRLKGYDYRQEGAYAVTVCTHQREDRFGDIVDGEMRLNDVGQIVEEEWLQTAILRPEIDLDAFVIMPNHFHAILLITDPPDPFDPPNSPVGARRASPAFASTIMGETSPAPTMPSGRPKGAPRRSLGALMGGFKSSVSRRVNLLRDTPGVSLWQRSFYDQLIGSEAMLNAYREYIALNPARWADDADNRINLRP